MRFVRALLVFACALATLPAAAPAAAQRALTDAQWREDLRFLAAELPRRHRDPFGKVTRAAFDSAVAELDARIPTLADHEVVVGMARIVALLRDGHTRLTLPQDYAVAYNRAHTTTPPPKDSALFLRHLPVKLRLFPEGLFVRAATAEHRGLIGARVLRIGRMAADSALEAVRPVVHHDNEMGFAHLAPTQLTVPEILHAQGISGSAERVRLRVRTAAGEERDVELGPVPLFAAPPFVEARDAAGAPAPLWERRLGEPYWMERLPGRRALYVQVNQIASDPREPMPAFAARIEQMVRDSAVERVILDLRHNPGGSGDENRSLVLSLLRTDADRFGRLFVLIGRETFSAAQMLVNNLELFSSALFVGEPTGTSPTALGDSRRFLLPGSGLTVRASSILWRDWSVDEKRPHTAPELPVALSAADYFANRDPVLEAALAFRAADDLAGLLAQADSAGGFRAATHLYYRFTRDARSAGVDVEPALLAFGERLLARGRLPEARGWLAYAARERPASAAVHAALARAHLRAGDRAQAEQAARKALELDPRSADAAELIRSLP